MGYSTLLLKLVSIPEHLQAYFLEWDNPRFLTCVKATSRIHGYSKNQSITGRMYAQHHRPELDPNDRRTQCLLQCPETDTGLTACPAHIQELAENYPLPQEHSTVKHSIRVQPVLSHPSPESDAA
jgi:hypothetical protein